jgi:glycosyltransferase involved in cell wall biosynthesis
MVYQFRARACSFAMKILLVQNSLYYPAYGGGNKSNRLLLEDLAGRGHKCRVVTRVSETLDAERLQTFLADLESRNVAIDSSVGGLVVFRLNGVDVHTETSVHKVRDHLVSQIEEFRPTWTLVSTDDPLQLFLTAALEKDAARVVYLARTTLSLPFGPDTAIPSEQRTENLRRVAGIVAVSNYVKDYIERHGRIKSVTLPISLHGDGPFPDLGSFGQGFVTMVNPCGLKGIAIFLELARQLPEFPFAAVPMWGTNEEDLKALEELSNLRLLPPVEKIDRLLAKTQVLLAPSLCNDAKPRIVFEAMSRGIPVLASDVGGVHEAMLGMDYILPVRPVEHYEAQMDSQMVPEALIPEQDINPWLESLRRVLSDREHYETLSRTAHARCAAHLAELSIDPFEHYLSELAPAVASESAAKASKGPLGELSPEKRALLLKRLKGRSSEGKDQNRE